MVDTAGTICEAVRTLNESGAKSVTLVATHGLLSGPAVEPYRAYGGPHRVHPLAQQRQEYPTQHVAGAALGHAGIAGGLERKAGIDFSYSFHIFRYSLLICNLKSEESEDETA